MTTRPRKPMAPADPKTFDLDAFLGMFNPPTVKVPLYKRADLLPEIDKLDEQIAAAEKHETQPDQSVSDGGGSAALVLRRNELIAELEASAEVFEFRALADHWTEKAVESAKADGRTLDLKAMVGDDWAYLRLYQMAATCISHPGITGKTFEMLWQHMGDATIMYMIRQWLSTQGLGDPEAPFSQPASPTPTTVES